MKHVSLFAAVVLLALPAFAQSPYSRDPIAFVDVNVIPMTSEVVLEHQTVYIRDGVIEGLGPADSFFIPEGTKHIDGAGKYLIPGLCDLHMHFFGSRQGNVDTFSLYVANGVTTVLNMRGTRGVLAMRKDILSGTQLGPRVYTASPILGNVSPTPATYDKGVEMVEEFAEDGYDFVKVYNQIPEEGYRGVIDAAKRLGIPVVGHSVRSVGLEGAMASGQSMAHMEEIIYGYFDDTNLDASKIEPLAKRMKESDISVITTLVAYHNIIRQVDNLDAMLASPGVEYLDSNLTGRWGADKNEYLSGPSPFDAAKADSGAGEKPLDLSP